MIRAKHQRNKDFDSRSQISENLEMADGVGFEPTDACTSPVFKTGALNRSATHPHGRLLTALRPVFKCVRPDALNLVRLMLPTGRAAAAMNDAVRRGRVSIASA